MQLAFFVCCSHIKLFIIITIYLYSIYVCLSLIIFWTNNSVLRFSFYQFIILLRFIVVLLNNYIHTFYQAHSVVDIYFSSYFLTKLH